jgi:MFS family permease
MDVGGLARSEVAQTLLAGSLAYGIGSVIFGTLADRMSQRLTAYKVGMALAVLAFFAIAAGVREGAIAIVMLYGFGACAAALPYAILSRHFPGALTGRVITASNIFMFLASFAFQWGIGALLRLELGYLVAFGVVGVLQLATLVWLLPMKEAKT